MLNKLLLLLFVFSTSTALMAVSLDERYEALKQERASLKARVEAVFNESQSLSDAIKKKKLKDLALTFSNVSKEFTPLGAQGKNNELPSLLERFVKRSNKKSDLTAHASMKLAELYFAEEEQAISRSEELGQVRKPNFSRSIKIYRELIRNNKQYPFLDVAYYMLGICYDYEDQKTKALLTWEKLVDLFPKSSISEEVWFRLGENSFSERNFSRAIKYYSEIDEDSGFYLQSLYKRSWTYYILNQFDKAISGFSSLLDQNSLQSSTSQTATILRAEAIEYLAFSFVDKYSDELEGLGKDGQEDNGSHVVKQTKAYFESLGAKSYARDVFKSLGGILSKLSRYEGAESAYLHAIDLAKEHPDSPEVLDKIIRFYDDANIPDKSMEYRKKLVSAFEDHNSWFNYEVDFKTAEVLSRSNRYAEDALLQLALYMHSQAKKTEGQALRHAEVLNLAVQYYLLYVNSFASSSNVDEIMFYLAEALFDLSRFKESAFAYEQLRDWPWQTAYRQKSTVNVVFALRKEIEAEQGLRNINAFQLNEIKSSEKNIFRGQANPLLKQWQESVERLAISYPKEKVLPVFLFESAGIFYRYGKIEEANRLFARIVASYPKQNAAKLSAHLLLEDKIAQGLWSEVVKDAQAFEKEKIGGETSQFSKIEQSARFKEAQKVLDNAAELERKQDEVSANAEYLKAADMFLNLTSNTGASSFEDKALYNAGMSLYLGKDLFRASKIFQKLYQNHSSSELAEDALLKNASYFEASLQLRKAASTYELYAKRYTGTKEGVDALLNAAILYQANGDKRTSLRIFEQFVGKHANHPEIETAKNEISLNKKKVASGKAKKSLQAILAEIKSYSRLRLNASSGKGQSSQLVRKTKKLSSIETKLRRFIEKYDGTKEGVEALYQIGVIYEGLYQTLLKAPCPKDVSTLGEDACDEYQSILEDKAFILETKAVKAYKASNSRALSIVDGATLREKAGRALHKLKPDEFPFSESMLKPDTFLSFCPSQSEKVAASELALVPSNLKARLSMIRHFAKEKKWQAVAFILEDSEKIDSENQACFDAWKGQLAFVENDWANAIRGFEKAQNGLSEASYKGQVSWLIANALVLNEKANYALSAYEKALFLDRNLKSVSYNLGLLYLNRSMGKADKSHNLNKAKGYFEQFINSKPKDKVAVKKAINFLRNLKQQIAIEERQAR